MRLHRRHLGEPLVVAALRQDLMPPMRRGLVADVHQLQFPEQLRHILRQRMINRDAELVHHQSKKEQRLHAFVPFLQRQ